MFFIGVADRNFPGGGGAEGTSNFDREDHRGHPAARILTRRKIPKKVSTLATDKGRIGLVPAAAFWTATVAPNAVVDPLTCGRTGRNTARLGMGTSAGRRED
jgi:hypothetical protein